MKIENGVHNIPNDVYHNSSGISRSALWKFKQSPAHYWHEYINPNFIKPDPNANMFLGSLVHTLFLEPDKFADEYIVEPELYPVPPAVKLKDVGRELFDRNKMERESISVANDLIMDEFNSKNHGLTYVTRKDMDQAHSMVQKLLCDDTALSLIDGAKIEQSIFFTHEPTGLQVKARPDAWLGSIVTDLKTCYDASFKAFQSEAMRYGYHLQAGMIKKALESIGIEMEKFVFMCVEKADPYHTATYILDDEAIDYGVFVFDELMARLKECCETDKWPAYPMKTLTLPGWVKYEEV